MTGSFGWDQAESFQQHDVQELLRVLFEALESEWKGTDLVRALIRSFARPVNTPFGLRVLIALHLPHRVTRASGDGH